MTTLRSIVSDLATDVKAINLDDRISYRFLLNKFNSKLNYFLRLEAKSREFAKLQSIWKPIDCIKLEQVDISKCSYIDNCKLLKRSVNEIPEAFATNYGLLIKILTIDGLQEFKLISNSSEYKDYINRRWSKKLKPVYIENKYLFVPDLDISSVKILIIPINPFEVDKANGNLTACSSPLDATIGYPEYLITLAKTEVLKELLPERNIVQDAKPNDNTNEKV